MISQKRVPLTILTARHVSNFIKEVDMLSWDDFNSEETQKTPAAEPAQAAIPQTAVVNNDAVTPAKNPPISTGSINDVSEALDNLDIEKGLEELEGASSRVDVDQKQMINCRADVNQLVLSLIHI